jgi:hypothetical protein
MAKKKKAPDRGNGQGPEQKEQQPEDIAAPSDSPAAGPLFHPACDLFPLIEGEEFDELIADIKANGLLQPITRYQGPDAHWVGSIIEGKNRYRACVAAGVEPIYVDKVITDPVAFVISANIRRRHLTSEQKRDLIAKLLQLDPAKSDRQIADTIGVSHHTVGAVRSEKEADGQIAQQAEIQTKDGKTRRRGKGSDKGSGKSGKGDKSGKGSGKSKKTAAQKKKRQQQDDVGPSSADELKRLRAREAELQTEVHRLTLQNLALEKDVKGLEAEVARLKELAAASKATAH